MKPKEMNFVKLNNNKVCQLCIDKVKPVLETRKIRKGRMTHRVPMITKYIRQEGKGIISLIKNANFRKNSDSKRFTQAENRSNTTIGNTGFTSAKTFCDTLKKASLRKNLSVKRKPTFVKQKQKQEQESWLSPLDCKGQKYSINPTWFSDYSLNFQKSSSCHSIEKCLAEEFLDSINDKSESIEKKKQLHTFALQNRASLHFRWW